MRRGSADRPRQGGRPRGILATAAATLAFALALGLELGLIGCATTGKAPASETPKTQVVSVTHIRAHETTETFVCEDPARAQELYDAYLQGVVGDPTDMWATDSDDTVVFTTADGGQIHVSFNAHNLLDGGISHTFDDKGGFWRLLAELDDE